MYTISSYLPRWGGIFGNYRIILIPIWRVCERVCERAYARAPPYVRIYTFQVKRCN